MSRPRTRHIVEEVFNSTLHGIGAIITISGIIYFTLFFTKERQLVPLIGLYFFLVTLFIMYLVSTLYHGLFFTRAKTVFLVLDYSAIFLFIAGTYTAFITAMLPNALGLLFMVIIWSVVITGISLRAVFYKKDHPAFVAVYLLLGWFALFLMKLIWHKLLPGSIGLLVAGGLCYSFGVIFYSLKKVPFSHTMWHVFIMAGTIFHALALTSL
jgi:hemolysin III